jgi:PilZ domain-containing protein
MQKRKYTRSGVWENTNAIIKVADNLMHDKRQFLTVQGKVENLGANGMFLLTNERVPVPAVAEITINFDTSSNMPDLLMTASGKTVRLGKNGVGIKFTTIDLSKLQKCIIQKINDSGITECEIDKYLLPESETK